MAVFARNEATLGGVFSADSATLGFGDGVAGATAPIDVALVQNLNGSFQQMVTRLYEIGGIARGSPTPLDPRVRTGTGNLTRIYYVGGRAQGQAAIARVIGPAVAIAAYYTKYGDVCQAATNTINLSFLPNCGGSTPLAAAAAAAAAAAGGPGVKYSLWYCVLINIGFAVAAQDMIFNENSALMFSDMDYNGA